MIETLSAPPSGVPSHDDGDRPGFLDCRGVWHVLDRDLDTVRSEGRGC